MGWERREEREQENEEDEEKGKIKVGEDGGERNRVRRDAEKEKAIQGRRQLSLLGWLLTVATANGPSTALRRAAARQQ